MLSFNKFLKTYLPFQEHVSVSVFSCADGLDKTGILVEAGALGPASSLIADDES